MNTIFNSDTNTAVPMSLNPNNIIIVSESSSQWSQEYTNIKSEDSLSVNNVMGIEMEENSNGTEDEEASLTGKVNVSEGYSEWSQGFMQVNEGRGPLRTINTDPAPGIQKLHGAYQNEHLDVNYEGTDNDLSNSMPESADLQCKSVEEQEGLEEFDNSGLLRCRTCLKGIDPEENIPLFTREQTGETLKDLLIYLLPQMASTVCDEDVVCKDCDSNIKFCVEFIDNCLKVETELLNEYEGSVDNQEEITEVKTKFLPEERSHVTLDHDYNVEQETGAVIKDIKTEDGLMEIDEAESMRTFLDDEPSMVDTEYLFECFRCGETFEFEHTLDAHARIEHGIVKDDSSDMNSHDSKIYYKCNVCEVLFATKQAFKSHVLVSHPDLKNSSTSQGAYTCKQCGTKFHYLEALFEHKRTAHMYVCRICPERFDTKEDLEVHMDTHPDLYSCEICNKGFKTRKSLTNHVLTHDGVNLCEECGRTFATPEELTQHIEDGTHSIKGTFVKKVECDICGAYFTGVRLLNKHKKLYHEGLCQYVCTVCDKNFSSKTSLTSHFRLKHAAVKPYQCERCGERFARLDYLSRHNNCSESDACKKFVKGPRRKFRYTKGDGEPVKCKLCGKVFKDVYLLKLHLTTHTNLRRFRCSVCNLTFTTNKNRERHEKIHDDPLSKYRCTVCWKRTQCQEELDEHIMSHEKKYQCYICQESFARVYLLNFHVSEEHADDEDVEKEKQIVFTEGLKEYLVEY